MILIFNKVAPGFCVEIKGGDAQKNTTTLTVKGKLKESLFYLAKKGGPTP